MSVAPVNELFVNASDTLGPVQAHPSGSVADRYDVSSSTMKIVYLSLLASVVLMASVAAYVWYGFSQWQLLP